jgi:acetoin:2,6-dichlorophenolindophenol oxidoreductase subunit beta
MKKNTFYCTSLNNALHDIFAKDNSIIILGEDILDPYGGAFKVTKGLSTAYPDRVITTPISEAAITGIGIGMALRGKRAIVEIMFSDFLTLAADQIINHAVKFESMYKYAVTVPLVVRTPVGAGRGYGPTHSQSLEKMFLGIPNLSIVAPSHFHDPGKALSAAVYSKMPVLFLEHKLLYPKKLFTGSSVVNIKIEVDGLYDVAVCTNYPEGDDPDVTIITYGGMSLHIEALLTELSDEEINCAAVLPCSLSQTSMGIIMPFVEKSKRVVIAEEGHVTFNWGSEIAKCIYEKSYKILEQPIVCVGTDAAIIPSSIEKESKTIVTKKKIENAVMEVLT